ncbi:MAG: hypothetical protein QXL40_04090 [Nitrososphaerota archaeon]
MNDRFGEAFCDYVCKSIRFVFHMLLGDSGASALENYLNRKLSRNMYEVFCSSPNEFYRVLKSFLGYGADALLKIVASKLIEEGVLVGLTPGEFVELLSDGSENARLRLLKSFRRV